MDREPRRSGGVIEVRSQPSSEVEGGSWERFESLYRTSRDDVYAYVATLLRDPAAAEETKFLQTPYRENEANGKGNLKAGNGIGGDGGVGAAHVGRGIDVIKRSC